MRGFVDVSFAVLVEAFQGVGSDLLSAIEKASLIGAGDVTPGVPDAVDNKASMDALMAAMSGVKGAPV